MKSKHYLWLAGIVVVLLVKETLYVVSERNLAAITQFSRLVRTEDNAGLKWKWPFIQQVEYFDKRTQRLNVDPELFLTNEKKYLIVDYYVEWKIGNLHQFYTSVQGNINRASSLLDQLVKDGLRGEFALRSVSEVISEGRSSIMDKAIKAISADAERRYGVEIVGIRLKRVDFSDDIRDRVFDRMRAERNRVSASLRAQGREKSQIIRATADREATEIIAKAEAQAQITRGEADAKAADVFAKAYGADLEFYKFWRSMMTYQKDFSSGEDVLLVKPDNPYLEYWGEKSISNE